MRFDNPFTQAEMYAFDSSTVTAHTWGEAAFQGLYALYTFNKFYLGSLLKGAFIAKCERESTIIALYNRTVLYLSSLVKLNTLADFQTVATSARSLFELVLDMALVNKDTTDESVDRLMAFTFVERYRVAKEAIDYFPNHPRQIDPMLSCKQDFCNDPKVIKKVDEFADKYGWRRTGGKLNLPKHWSRKDARSRSRHVGEKWEARYIRTYMFSWYVHSGLPGIHGFTEQAFEIMNMDALRFSYDVILDGLKILGQEIHLVEAVPKWSEGIAFFDHLVALILLDKFRVDQGEASKLNYLEEHEREGVSPACQTSPK
ncbi:MAG: DUF5677 domain-containing protein [Candidatus Kryptoniota bacterium]